jgi:hypothetical protein
MYETLDKNGVSRRIDFTVWSEVFTCPECGCEVTFLDEALEEDTGKTRDEFSCPGCSAHLTKRKLQRLFETVHDPLLAAPWKRVKFKPCLIQFRVGKVKHEKIPDQNDLDTLARIDRMSLPSSMPANHWPIEQMYHGSRIAPKGFTHTHQFFIPRAALAMHLLWQKASAHSDRRLRSMLLYFVEQAIWTFSRLNRYRPTGFSQVNQFLTGVYYLAAQHAECSPWYILEGKAKRLASTFGTLPTKSNYTQITTGSASLSQLPENSMNYIFTDPPFGENIFYADMNILVESWHRVFTNSINEAIIDGHKGKGLQEYQLLMLESFREYFRVLKPGRWITVEFSNSKAAVWNSIQTTLQEAGFVVANVAALNKGQRSFRSVTSPTAVKQDLVITAYKPNGGLEDRFAKVAGQAQGAWEFVRSHLKYLPVVMESFGTLEFIVERDPRIIFDRMVAFYFQHGIDVPLSSGEFQLGLSQFFSERDGMIFLPDQATEHDRKKLLSKGIGQRSLLVDDERSAIDWLTEFLKSRPSESSDIVPHFMEQLRGSTWKKGELQPELHDLLRLNFLCFDGEGDVPSQIHSYLSTNFKESRNLAKNDSLLQAKAKDRWYVPDPNNAIQLEKTRERDLLRAFEVYRTSKDRKIPEFRIEALRAGFKKAWQDKDYQTIITTAAKIPEAVIQEDPKLLMWHSNACTRAGVDQ